MGANVAELCRRWRWGLAGAAAPADNAGVPSPNQGPEPIAPGAELDAAFRASATVSTETFDAVMAEYRRASDAAVRGLSGHANVAFDTASDERLDVWGVVATEARPVVLAVHGGYWRMLSRHETAFMAAPLAERGIATVSVDYTLSPLATIEEIVRQVRTAVAWIHQRGTDHGLDPERLVVVGSSAGAHLAAMTAVQGWQRDLGLSAQPLHGVMLLSGLFDLRPLVSTFANDWLGLDLRRAAAMSPLLAEATSTPAVIAVAEREATGFHQQSRRFADRWQQTAPTTRRTIANRNHFDVFLDLADPNSQLFSDLVALTKRPMTDPTALPSTS